MKFDIHHGPKPKSFWKRNFSDIDLSPKNKGMKKTGISFGVIFFIILFIFVFAKIVSPHPCKWMSDEKCFQTLIDCKESESARNFMLTDKGIKKIDKLDVIWEKDSKEPIPGNFDNAKIYSGTGSRKRKVFINKGNQYCLIMPEKKNFKTIFGPIKSKSHALDYYMFFSKKIRGDNAQYIFEKNDYDKIETQCTEAKELLRKKRTKISREKGGYLLTTVYFSSTIRDIFYESKIRIDKDGTIHEVSSEVLIDCQNPLRNVGK